MRYHRKSLAKRFRKHGFRIRQRTGKGRLIHTNKRRQKRSVNIRSSFS